MTEQNRRLTVKTISEMAGVSSSTVSRALNGNPAISKPTRDRILSIAAEIGYTPNAIARGLVTQHSGVIGFIVGDMKNPFYPEQMERLLRHLSERSMQLMLFYAKPDQDVAEVLPALLEYQLDGCIIASVPLSSKAGKICAKQSLPTVLINRVGADQDTCSVLCNNRWGGYQAAQHFIENGRLRCGFVAGRANTLTAIEREQGFTTGLRDLGYDLCARAEGLYTFEGGYNAALELLAANPRPDAIFAANDLMAIGVLDALRDQQVAVPDEVAVIGFDGINAAAWPAYSLTTIVQPADALISRAVDLLVQRIANPALPPESVTVNGTLTLRNSTPKPKKR